MPIVLRIYLRPSSFQLVVVCRPENSSLRFVFVVRLSFDRCLLVLCFQRHPIRIVLAAEPWGLSLESLQVEVGETDERPDIGDIGRSLPLANRVDLLWLHTDAVTANDQAQVRGFGPVELTLLWVQVQSSVRELAEYLADVDDMFLKRLEIGRASCRERV